MATEDIPYNISDFATPDKKVEQDPDQPNKSVLVELYDRIEKDIAYESSFDSIALPLNATPEQKIAVFDEMAIHKGLAMRLIDYKNIIGDKLKELR